METINNDYILKLFNLDNKNIKSLDVMVDVQSYKCPECSKTFYEHNPFTTEGMKISLSTVYNVLNDLKKLNETFTAVVHRYNISPTAALTDISIFLEENSLNAYVLMKFMHSHHQKVIMYVFFLISILKILLIYFLQEENMIL